MKKNKAPITITAPVRKIDRLLFLGSPKALIEKTYRNQNIYFNVRGARSYGSLGWNTNNNAASKFAHLEYNKLGTTVTLSKDLELNFIHNAQSSEFKKASPSSGIKINNKGGIDFHCIGTITGGLKFSLNILEYDNNSDRMGIARVPLNKEFRYMPNAQVKKIVLNLRLEGKGRLFLKEIKIDFDSKKELKTSNQTNDSFESATNAKANVGVIPSLYRATQSKPHTLKNTRIAGIMDPFTQHSYENECDVLQLHPESWQQQLIDFAPHFVFIESAWQGLDSLWKTKISHNSVELQAILSWCNGQKIPTLLWNKEDPVHYGTFLKVAQQVDYIFTTDIDCIPKYKHDCNTENVFLLPFAAQTKNHNPIESFPRKDGFCFAGSYYLRYPERQKDIAMLTETVSKFEQLEIYDRNFDNDHPHYKFPESFSKYIVGTLPFEKIDVAYKGYKYGINLNTIKESQSMFARRVFELMASNTIVVSNFSRGMRRLFGDLVISSDKNTEIQKKLKPLIEDDIHYKKHRLLALRKVMSEHTYKHRLSYLLETVKDWHLKEESKSIVILGIARSANDIENLKLQFIRQSYADKFLCIYLQGPNDTLEMHSDDILITSNNKTILEKIDCANYIGIFSATDYYGENYLLDSILATNYSDADGIGKHCYYHFADEQLELSNSSAQYQDTSELLLHRSIMRSTFFSEEKFKEFVRKPENVKLTIPLKLLALDEFNYCSNVQNISPTQYQEMVDDLKVFNCGTATSPLYNVANRLPASESDRQSANPEQVVVTAAELHESIPQPTSSRVSLTVKNDELLIESKLDEEQHAYLYCEQYYLREDLNLRTNSEFQAISDLGDNHVKVVFEFFDDEKNKLSHHMGAVGEAMAMAIPNECQYVRLGLRLLGTGCTNISNICLLYTSPSPRDLSTSRMPSSA